MTVVHFSLHKLSALIGMSFTMMLFSVVGTPSASKSYMLDMALSFGSIPMSFTFRTLNTMI